MRNERNSLRQAAITAGILTSLGVCTLGGDLPRIWAAEPSNNVAQAEAKTEAAQDVQPAEATTGDGMSFDLEGVTVEAKRPDWEAKLSPGTVTVIRPDDYKGEQKDLPDLLKMVPGVHVRELNGKGQYTTVSVRGSTAAQVGVFVDGVLFNLGGDAAADISTIPVHNVERIEVYRGYIPARFGGTFMGGVINIVTRQLHEEGVKTNLNLGYGSFNTLQSEVTNRIRKGGFTSLISGSYNRTDGHRRNMGFEQYGGYAKLGYEFSPYWNIRGDVNVTHFNASQPGEVTDPMIDADQSITRGMTSVAVENRYERTSGAVSFFYNWGDHWINDGYTANPDDKNNPKPYRFDSHDDMMGISWYQSAQLFTGNRLTAGVDYYRFGGKAQNRYVEGERNGEREHIVDKVQHEIAGYIDFRQDISHWLTLDAGIRIDHHSHIGTEWIPQAGLSFHLPGSIELKASAGKGFRYPTIREMYMFPPKNPDLRPESMWNYELAFAQRLLDGRLSYGINVFYIDGKNLIVAVPRAGATPLNMNTGKIDNTGVEVEAAYRIHPHWSVETNYSYLHMDNPVLGAPEHKFYAGAMFSKNRWTVSTGLQYVANLYTDVDHVQTEDFVLWNINGSFKVTEWFDIWARGENLLAQRYEINAGYPMPKATIMAGINVKF